MYLGFDIGGTNIKYGIFQDENLIEFGTVKTMDGKILYTIRRIAEKYKNLKGIGIAAAGFVNKKNEVIFSPNINEFRNLNFKDSLKDLCENVKAINDVNAMALCEIKYGYGKKYKNFIVLALGTGVGGAIVIDGKLYLGSNGFAGEFGHTTISLRGKKCKCGRKGCLEAFIGRRYILDSLPKGIDMIDIYKFAKKGNKYYIRILEKYSKYLSLAITNFINILDPEAIILSGGVANDIILRFTQKRLKKEPIYRDVKLHISKFKDKAGVIGAIIYLKDSGYVL